MTVWSFIVAERMGFKREEALSIGSSMENPVHALHKLRTNTGRQHYSENVQRLYIQK